LSISGVIANNDAMKSVGAYSSVEIEIVFIESENFVIVILIVTILLLDDF
jgi:hypothetical protein